MTDARTPGVEDDARAFVPLALEGAARFRRFGEHGPLYEVTAVSGQRVRIRVVLSGEETEYPLEAALADPLG
jgi:hypothetical protein